MGKVQIKKKDTWIDMTPMSDVMVLLLTFFMLTSTFVKNEPVKVVTPGSVSEIKVPEKDVLTLLIDKTGKIFMQMDNQLTMDAALADVTGKFGVSLDAAQSKTFVKASTFGVPMDELSAFLKLSEEDQAKYLTENGGIPTDSIDGGPSEMQVWVRAMRDANDEIKVAIKSDGDTPYKVIKTVMNELQSMNENRYYLITSLEKAEE